jgi:hypothetical protein
MNSAANQELPFYDVVVVGGSLSGAATATLLLRKNPGLKLLLLKNRRIYATRWGSDRGS